MNSTSGATKRSFKTVTGCKGQGRPLLGLSSIGREYDKLKI
jgi:hypothetical protein